MTRGSDWPPSREAGPGEQTARLPLEDRGQGQVRGKPAAHRVSDGKESCECSRMCGGYCASSFGIPYTMGDKLTLRVSEDYASGRLG